jgi:putative transposase
MRLLDEQYTRTPFYGIKKMTAWLRSQDDEVNHKRVARLLRQMGLMAIYPAPRLSQPGEQNVRYPYVLRGMSIDRVNQVWSTDITSIRLQRGFLYLVAIIDWFSRYVLAWRTSISARNRVLSRSARAGIGEGTTGNFQQRPGIAVYQYGIDEPAQGRRRAHQLGWQRKSIGQYFR